MTFCTIIYYPVLLFHHLLLSLYNRGFPTETKVIDRLEFTFLILALKFCQMLKEVLQIYHECKSTIKVIKMALGNTFNIEHFDYLVFSYQLLNVILKFMSFDYNYMLISTPFQYVEIKWIIFNLKSHTNTNKCLCNWHFLK